MTKEKEPIDINNGFKVGDIVKGIKHDIQGRIKSFEWSGIRRAAIESGKKNNSLYIVSVLDLELVSRAENMEPVEITKTEKDIEK